MKDWSVLKDLALKSVNKELVSSEKNCELVVPANDVPMS